MPALPAMHHLPVGQQDRCHGQVEVPGIVGGPRPRGEVLHQSEGRREFEHRVAVVVGPGWPTSPSRSRRPPTRCPTRRRPGRHRPSTLRPATGRRRCRPRSRRECLRPRAPPLPSPGRSNSPRSCRRSRRPPDRRRGLVRSAGGGRRGRPPAGPPVGSARWTRSPRSRPTSTWAGAPCLSSSATTKSSPRASSTTGVPVIPTVGSMSPQGNEDAGTGRARWLDQRTAPVEDDRAYTVSFSVAR